MQTKIIIDKMWVYDRILDVFWYDNKWYEKDGKWCTDSSVIFAVPDDLMDRIREFRKSGDYIPCYRPTRCSECACKTITMCDVLSTNRKKVAVSKIGIRKDCPLKEREIEKKKYTITITETRTRDIVVSADSYTEALENVELRYKLNQIDMTDSYVENVEFSENVGSAIARQLLERK